jgi:hypothetical protein
MTYARKLWEISKKFPKIDAPFLPIMIYVIERGCIAAGIKIPPPAIPQTPQSQLPPPTPMRGRGVSDLDKAFRRCWDGHNFQSSEIKENVLHRLVRLASSYRGLPDAIKLKFGPPELIALDASIKYDSESFKPYYKTHSLPPPPDPSVPPKIDNLLPSGIPGGYGPNTSFQIIGRGFSLNLPDNNIVISQVKTISIPDEGTQIKEVEIPAFKPNKVISTKEMEVTVPGSLQPLTEPYNLRVEVTIDGKKQVTDKVKFKVIPNPTVLESPSITKADPSVVSGSSFFVSGKSVGPANIIKKGQGVTPDQKTVPVFLEARLISGAESVPQVNIMETKATSSPIKHLSVNDLQIKVPEDTFPGQYKLQLVSRLQLIDLNSSFTFDTKGGVSDLQDLLIRAPLYRVIFTSMTCNDESNEPSFEDEIMAVWSMFFDNQPPQGGPSSIYDMDEDDTKHFQASDNPFADGNVGDGLLVMCTMFEVDTGDKQAQVAALNFIAALATAVAPFFPIAAVVAGVAAGLAGLIAGIANENDLLGVDQRVLKAAALRKGTANKAKITDVFSYGGDGSDYKVNFEISRID